MTKNSSYPFYKSIRFRFGLLFNFLLLVFLSAIIFLLYGNVQHELEKDLLLRLSAGAKTVLQKTEVNPVIIPLPQSNEYFELTYNNGVHVNTLFTNLTEKNLSGNDSVHKSKNYWSIKTHKTLETGGIINLLYVLPAKDYNAAVYQLRLLLFIYIPVAILISFIAGYFLSGIFLKPLKNIIAKANQTDLTNNIKLLDAPVVKDELHELVEALNRMLLRIEKQSQQQNAFFASASHELRTPLSNMLTELQTIATANFSPSIQMIVQNQTDEVQRLKKLVNNFLLMSQLKAESVFINKTNFNIAELCMEVIAKLKALAAANSQAFRLNVLPVDTEFSINADQEHFSIILNNLFTNAIKYGKPDTLIDVAIFKNNEVIRVSIENKTESIIENVDDLKNHFERAGFYKEGFGLGLWIADELLKKNNGCLNLFYRNGLYIATVILTENQEKI